jgi:hypothetical protein
VTPGLGHDLWVDFEREILIRASEVDARMEPLVREAGFRLVNADELKGVAHEQGLWPGISGEPEFRGRDSVLTAATHQPWVDANGFRVGWLKALHPERPAVLAYEAGEKAGLKPDRMVPNDSVELALVEAWVSGGNYVLSLPQRYRELLLRQDDRALADWKQLARTARWLQANIALFRQPAVPIVTLLVDPTETSAEVANLMYRQNVSPALAAATAPPAPDAERIRVLAAVSVEAPGPAARKTILAHAEAGATVVVDATGEKAWWRDARLKLNRKQDDRDFYTLGRGKVVAYHEQISDVYEFAFDVIDLVGQKARAVRMWNAPAQIGRLTSSPRPRGAVLSVVNYGRGRRWETLVRVQGVYSRATLLRPDSESKELKVAKRGTTTEIQLPEMGRLGVVVFS